MRHFYLTITLLFVCIANLTAQALQEQPINPDFINYMQATNFGSDVPKTEDGFSLGFMPSPYPANTEGIKIKKERNKIQAPPNFDLRNVSGINYVTSVKNQGSCGSCWAFATTSAIESHELKTGVGTRDYSEQNIKNCHGFIWGHCDGGTEQVAAAYMVRNEGPVYESDDPYNIYDGVCSANETRRSTYLTAVYMPNRRTNGYMDVLKDVIMEHGAVFTAMCWSNSAYNSLTYCYRYAGTSWANHAIAVIGWDDGKDMSSVGATTRGAWICKNSWGTSFGQSGYFYISYEDVRMNDVLMYFKDRVDYNTNAKLYGYDKLGSISGLGYGNTTGYALVKFVASSNSQITKLSTWVRSTNARVTFEVYDEFSNGNLTGLLGSISEQTVAYAGHYTFDLTTPINWNQGNDIYVKVKYVTPSYYYPIPIEKVASYYCNPTIESNVSWVGSNGTSWQAVGANVANNNYDVCIRAYAVNTNNSALQAPTLQVPTNNALGVSLTPTMQWQQVQGATGYDIQLSEFSNFDSPIVNISNTPQFNYEVPANLLENNTIYFWRVRARQNSTLSDWASRQFTTLNSLAAPIIVAPANQATNESVNPKFSWNALNGAESYDFQISRSPVFDVVEYEKTSFTSTSFTMSDYNLDYSFNYYWRVRGKAGLINGPWANSEFETGSQLSAPQLIAPSQNANNVPLYATLDWSDVNGAGNYEVEVCSNSSFTNPCVDLDNLNSSQYSLQNGQINAGTTYYWRARAENGNNCGPWNTGQFTSVTNLTAPTLVSPNNAQSNVAITPELDWSDVAGAASYSLQVSSNSSFSSLIFTENNISNSEFSVPSGRLNFNTYYYWRVKSVSGGSESSWSSYRYFRTKALSPPSLENPSYYATNVTLTPNFNWSDISGADGYTIQVSQYSSYSTLLVNAYVTSSEYQMPSNLLNPNTSYYWRVSTKCGSSNSSWTYSWRFTTGGMPGPSIVSPSDNSLNISLTPSLDWSDVTNADSYELQISTLSYFGSYVLNLTNLASSAYNVASNTLSESTKYYWRIRYKMGGYASNWTTGCFTTLTLNGGPTLVSPSNNASGQELTPTLDWSDVQDATRYILQVATSSQFSNIIIEQTSLTSSNYSIPANTLGYSSYYWWRVKAVTNNDETGWSSVFKFTTKSVPVPTLRSPSFYATNVSLTPTMSWDAIDDAVCYDLQISRNSYFSDLVVNQSGLTSNSFNVPTNTLSYSTTYYWRVRVKIGDQYGYYSTRFAFTTRQSKSADEDYAFNSQEEDSYDINVFPNPTADVVNIEGNFKSAVNVEVRLTDLAGKLLLKYGASKVKNYTDRFYLDTLPSGMYIMVIRINGKETIRRIVKY